MSKNPPRPLRLALIGCGRVAASHLRAVRHLAGKLVLCGVADTDAARAQSLLSGREARGHRPSQTARVYTDYRKMLDAEHPDIVAVTTPSGTHAAMGIDSMRAGAHLVMEKPLTLSLVEADRLLVEAESLGKQIAVGHKFRYVPLMRELHDAVAGGLIGDVLQGRVHVRWGHDQAYYDLAAWRGTWELDGGSLMNQSIHGLDLLLWLMDSPACRATGLIARRAHRMEAEDVGMAVLELQSGALCLIEGTTNTPPRRQEAEISLTGTKGTLTAGIGAGRPRLSLRDQRGKSRTAAFILSALWDMARGQRLYEMRWIAAPHTLLYADFLAALEQRRAPRADGASGRAAVETVLAVYASALSERTVSMPLMDFPLEHMQGFFHDI